MPSNEVNSRIRYASPQGLTMDARLSRRNECWRICSESYGALFLVRAILQEINGGKRPEKTKYYFTVSNSTLFEANVIFI